MKYYIYANIEFVKYCATMKSSVPSYFKERIKASAVHFVLSVAIAALAAILVFGLWYPYPYREISGGRELFLLIVSVDVILGPLITFSIFDRRKPWSELRRDLVVVVILQTSALGYGLWTVVMARPVHMVFEIDRFRIVHAIDVPEELLSQAPEHLAVLPFSGPTMLGLRPFADAKEQSDATLAALGGVSLSSNPQLWQTYDASRKDVLRIAKPIELLRSRFPIKAASIDAVLFAKGDAAKAAMFVPLAGRNSFWTVLIDGRNGEVLGYLPLDSF